MTEEKTVVPKPSLTIQGVQITVDDLPKDGDGRHTFGKLQRLIQKQLVLSLDLEEIQMAINGFTAKIIAIVNEAKEPTPVNGEEESSTESDKDSE